MDLKKLDTKKFLEDMLSEGRALWDRGKGYVDKGTTYAADQMGAQQGSDQHELYKKLAGGAAAAGALALALGTKGGGRLLKLGALVGIGTLAYRAYQKSQDAGADGEEEVLAIEDAVGEDADRRARTLLRAMITAARADGRITPDERALIEEKLTMLGDEAQAFLMDEMMTTRTPEDLAAEAASPQEAREIYVMSALVCGGEAPAERAHLAGLAAALGLAPAVVAEIEAALRADGNPASA